VSSVEPNHDLNQNSTILRTVFGTRLQALQRKDHKSILRTVFETEAETLILPLALDLAEKAETRTMPLVTENCPDY
jgi:hypothetical protein